MKYTRATDFLLNGLLPVLSGILLYYFAQAGRVHPYIKNYLPDAFWAYAFVSTILITWKRNIPLAWVLVVYFMSALFEFFQCFQLIPGRADIIDVIVYFAFISLGLLCNSFFKKFFYSTTSD